jgi:hypothetical protein
LHLRSLPAPAAGVQLVNKASGEVLIDHDTGLPLWPDCNRRRLCPLAAKRYTRKIRLRLLRIAWRTMLTVTMPPELGKANRENIAVQGKALRRLLRVLKRRAGQFQLAWFREQVRGRLHLHLHLLCSLALNPPFKELISAAGFGAECDIRPIHDRHGAVRYVSKDLLKITTHPAANWPPYTRRYGTSNVPQLPSATTRYARIYNPSYPASS